MLLTAMVLAMTVGTEKNALLKLRKDCLPRKGPFAQTGNALFLVILAVWMMSIDSPTVFVVPARATTTLLLVLSHFASKLFDAIRTAPEDYLFVTQI